MEKLQTKPILTAQPKLTAPPELTTGPAPAASRGGLMLAVLLTGQFMCIIDVLVVNVAMPSIGASLHASGTSLQLVVGGYTIAYAMLLITGARLGDRYGLRRVYQARVITFTAASLACTLAPDSQLLVAFRFAQGVGAAALVPQVFSLIQLRFTGPARARALSAYAAVLSAGAVAGLVLGGAVVSADLFGLGLAPGVRHQRADRDRAGPGRPPPDPARQAPVRQAANGNTGAPARPGLPAGAVPAVLLIVLPLVLGHEAGWPPAYSPRSRPGCCSGPGSSWSSGGSRRAAGTRC